LKHQNFSVCPKFDACSVFVKKTLPLKFKVLGARSVYHTVTVLETKLSIQESVNIPNL